MKKIIFLISCFILLALVVIYFFITGFPIPRNYRYSSEKTTFNRMLSNQCRQVDWNDIEDLNIFGSGYLKTKHLERLLSKIKAPLFIFSAGVPEEDRYYYNEHNLKWYYGPVKEGDHWLMTERSSPKRERYQIRKMMDGLSDINAIELIDEKEMLLKYPQVTYLNPVPITWMSDFRFMDDVIQDFESIPIGSHVYFHCNHGRGRTTIFMTLYDIFRNHKNHSIENLIARQYCMGGEDIEDVNPIEGGTWKPEALIGRRNLVHYFYAYMTDPEGYEHKKWSDWLRDKNIQPNFDFIKYKRERE